jgi:hypothetical protein
MSEQQTPYIASTNIVLTSDSTYSVAGFWAVDGVNLDQPMSSGYEVRTMRLAERLAKAIRDGKVFVNPTIATDMGGKTYVSATSTVLGRTVNADLRRMGY